MEGSTVPDINIQFHATPDEIAGWLREWIECEQLYLVALTFSPFQSKVVELDKVQSTVKDQAIKRLSLLIRESDLTPKYQSDFDDRHSDQLVLDVGHLTPEGLRESWMACRTNSAEAFTIWKRIAKDIRAKTEPGVTATDIETGASAFYKSHRYTDGAKALENRGVVMLPIQGMNGPLLRLGGATNGDL
jgi:hypothetical protein